jgi:lysophospholipase L1-like esterase
MRKSTALAAVVLVLLGVWAVREERSERSARRSTTSTPEETTPATPDTTTGSPAVGPLHVVTYGDSVPAGSLCDCTDFPSRVARRLGSDLSRPVTSDNLAVSGFTSADVLDQVASSQAAPTLAHADLVIIEIGANDFSESLATMPECSSSLPCDQDDLDALRANLEGIVRLVDAVPGPADRTVALLGYWNIFKDGAVAQAKGGSYVAGSDALTRQVNAVVAGVAAKTDALYIDVYGPFAAINDPTDHLAPDGDHPNAAGHELLAKAVVSSVERLQVLQPGA